MIKNLSLVMLWMLLAPSIHAGVFRCTDPTGHMVFRDTPCESALERQEVLPYESQPTSAKVVREEEREAKAILKQAEKEEKKQERLSVRCERTREKITEIEAELRVGCKVGRCQRLKKERKHHEAMGRRYCAGES